LHADGQGDARHRPCLQVERDRGGDAVFRRGTRARKSRNHYGLTTRADRREKNEMTISTIDNSQRTAAKVAGWSGLLTFAIVVFGNYVLLNPLFVPADAAQTAQNILGHQTQFRIAAVCFLTY